MWWFKRPKRTFPEARGSYVPGSTDVMTGYSKDEVFFRLFYPTSLKKNNKKDFSGSWFNWLENEQYLYGFSKVANIWVCVIKLTLWLFGGDIYVPAVWDAEPKKDGSKMPVIVYSHGFGACRFMYCCTAIELASRGYLVATIEHRDSSACATYYYKSSKERDDDIRTWIPFIPLMAGQDFYSVRKNQLEFRKDECIKVLNRLIDFNEGKGDNIIKSSFKIKDLQGRLDFSNACLMGHSFGGATTLYTLANELRFKVGVLLDCWMYPLKKDKDLEIVQPLSFINTLTFHSPSNLNTIRHFMNNKPSEKSNRCLYTIRNTTHESQTDTPLVLGYWLDLFMKKLDPLVALKINDSLILRFLNEFTGISQDPSEFDHYLEKHNALIVPDMIYYTKEQSNRVLISTKK